MAWTPTFEAARARLDAFAPQAGRAYAAGRNSDTGSAEDDAVSRLSPWIRHGLLSERTVLAETLAHHDPGAAEKFIQEVVWRGYFKGWLEHRPGVWADYRASVRDGLDQLDMDGALRADYEAAIAGRTGMACFDHWARELIETGYLHNHARMWFASIWIFTLRLPWALGADFFLRHLLDGDPASNTLSWRWVGGLHTRGKHYLARASNIVKFTGGRFDPSGQLDETAEPLEETSWHEAVAPDLPIAPVITGRAGIVLSPDSLPDAEIAAQAQAAIGLAAPGLRSPLETPAPVADFERDAVAARLGALDLDETILAEPADPKEAVATISGWAQAEGVETVILPWTTVGPYADLTAVLDLRLGEEGLSVVRPSRRYDRLVWPHATAGFFKVKKQIPAILSGMDLV